MLETIKAIATKFQIDNQLDRTDIPQMLQHDYLHATLGFGVTAAEEELIEAVELCLEHGATWNAQALELARSLPVEFRALYKFGNI